MLFEYGGVYLDTDVEVIKSFNPYLHHPSFCGYEARQYIGTGIIVAEKGCEWIGLFLAYYMKRHFINITGHPVRTANTKLLTLYFMPKVPENKRPVMYPIDYFSGHDWETNEIIKTENTVSIHHYYCSWKRKKKTLRDRINIIMKGLKVRYLMRSCKSDLIDDVFYSRFINNGCNKVLLICFLLWCLILWGSIFLGSVL